MADEASNIVINWLTTTTAKEIVGVMKFTPGASTEIWENIAREAQSAALDDEVDPIIRKRRWKDLKKTRKLLKKLLTRSRKRLFNKTADERLYGPAGVATRIANARKRASRTHCGLDLDEMDKHTEYFSTTFGAQPTGSDLPNAHWIGHTDPTKDRWQGYGDNGIYAEMMNYAAKPMRTVIWLLVRILATLCASPRNWSVANVCHVWKQKGDCSDAADYRPISLVSRLRMVFKSAIRPKLLHVVNQMLDIAQGGFRDNRSTMDQILNLNEVLARYPDLIT
ncbi:UNVERIFIED_CONTAM: hypothetical protein HDU68_009724, partial [Siphonaria sp. JEL0065]